MNWISRHLRQITAAGLYRYLISRPSLMANAAATSLTIAAQCSAKSYDFASNDYLGLSAHPEVIGAACAAMQQWGSGGMSSRLVYGNTTLHEELEQEFAQFMGFPAGLIFSSGYLANCGVISALCDKQTIIYSDRNVHASLIDGMRLARSEIRIFPAGDIRALHQMLLAEHALGRNSGGDQTQKYPRGIISDAIYSTSGAAAPVAQLYELGQQFSALVIIDEAHAIGTYGSKGQGVVHSLGLAGAEDLIVTGTLSKSFAAQGGVVLCDHPTREYLINAARPFIFDTAVTPAALGAARAALKLLQENPHWVSKLAENAVYVREQFIQNGIPVIPAVPSSPIISLRIPDPELAYDISRQCAAQGVSVGCFRPPATPVGQSRLRITIKASHTIAELYYLITTVLHHLNQYAITS